MITSRLFVDSGHCSVHSARARSSRLAQFMGSTSGKYGNPHTNAHFVHLDVFCTGRSWSSTTVCSKRLRWHISVPHAPVHVSAHW